jgi:ribosome-associated translation inhibitor RaiA
MNKLSVLPKDKIAEDSIKLRLAISNDSLAIIKKEPVETKNDLDYLIKGSNNSIYIVEGDSNDIYKLIDICFDAIENNKTVEIELYDEIIVFN